MAHLQQILPCRARKCHIYHSTVKKNQQKNPKKPATMSLESSPEIEKPKEKTVPFLFSSVQDPLHWQRISEHSEDAWDHSRYSPELSRLSWELGSEIQYDYRQWSLMLCHLSTWWRHLRDSLFCLAGWNLTHKYPITSVSVTVKTSQQHFWDVFLHISVSAATDTSFLSITHTGVTPYT